ncbi:syntaxin-like protein [Microdochium nivale]|nr:syntaxin-like protein [Microdochium nivale]
MHCGDQAGETGLSTSIDLDLHNRLYLAFNIPNLASRLSPNNTALDRTGGISHSFSTLEITIISSDPNKLFTKWTLPSRANGTFRNREVTFTEHEHEHEPGARMMSSTNEEDPFLQVQQDVLAQLQNARPLFASYLRIRSLGSSGSTASPELAGARSDLEAALETLDEDLVDLNDAVRAVESNPAQFGLSAAEVTRRKRFVTEVGNEIEDMQDEVSKSQPGGGGGSSSAAARAAKAAANGDLPDPNAFAIPGDDDDDTRGDPYAAEFEERQQMQIMREQDDMMDGTLRVTVGNLRRQADDMGRELEEQREMLEVVDTIADRVGGRLQMGVAKLNHIVRQNEDKYSSCCVAMLILVLIVLLVLLLIL